MAWKAWVVVLILVVTSGCMISDYPVITDDRGDYSGIIRTGHKAYIVPTGTGAIIWDDGSDHLYSTVYQNGYGDQVISTFNNFDPTASTIFLDQTYCDWKLSDCEVFRAWNPVQNDDWFDYQIFWDCPGERSMEIIVAMPERIGECGDRRIGFRGNLQEMAEAFASLETTTWRGETAYHLPLDATNVSMSLVSESGQSTLMPIFGRYDLIVTDRLEMIVPMTPNSRHQRAWLLEWIAQNGPDATLRYDYRGISAEHRLRFRPEGIAYNLSRY